MRRVVITGMGAISPLGIGVDYIWKNLIASKSGIRKIQKFNIDFSPSKIAGEIPEGSKADGLWNIEEWFSFKESRRVDTFISYAIVAARQAMADSGLSDILTDKQKEEFGVNVGSGIGGLEEIYKNAVILANGQYRKMSPFFIPASLINLATGMISIDLGLKGPNTSVVTACTTGTHAIGDSYRLIQHEYADFMLAGGTESAVNPLGIAGFARMNALSTNFNDKPTIASRPWDKARDGFVISEGAAVVLLEEYEHAKKRGATIYAEVYGYGMSGDANHITSPASDGEGAARCMAKALANAKMNPEQIDYINAHGTSTPLGDVAEVQAIKQIFKSHAYQCCVSSTKSATGHLLGATGALEAIFMAKALQTGIIPPTLNLDNPEEGCDLNFVPHHAQEHKINYAMSNSFGFGGTNATLIFKK